MGYDNQVGFAPAHLSHHQATRNLAGNHFNNSDQASRFRLQLAGNGCSTADRMARAERLLAAREANARWAGRHLASSFLFQYRSVSDHRDLADLRLLIGAPGSVWLQKKLANLQVHQNLWGLAEEQMRNELAARGLAL